MNKKNYSLQSYQFIFIVLSNAQLCCSHAKQHLRKGYLDATLLLKIIIADGKVAEF